MKETKNIILVVLICMFSIHISSAQKQIELVDFNYESHKEIGLNFTQFVAQFIPFNIKSVKDGPIGYSFKRYNRSGKAFRFGFGANISANFENSFLAIRIGYERRKQIAKKVFYTRGWDILSVAGTLNLPNSGSQEIFSLGLGPVIGLEYHLTNALLISTESMLFVGLGLDEEFLNIRIIPPTALLVHFRF